MKLRKNQAFWTSVILHLVVVFALLLGVLIEAFKPKEEELHVFQMVDTPTQNASVVSTPPPIEPQQVEPTEMVLPDIPDLASIPEPTPVTPVPQPVAPAPTPTPQPSKPKDQSMSYEDFLKQNPIKERKPRQTQTQKSIPKFEITPGKIRVPDTYIASPSNQAMSSQEKDAMRRYVAQISGMLNRAWIKPGSLAGFDIKVVAIFYVDSSGRISNIRFQPSSGNASFDTSVKAAFAKIGSAGPTPTGKGQEIRISFNMLD